MEEDKLSPYEREVLENAVSVYLLGYEFDAHELMACIGYTPDQAELIIANQIAKKH